MGVGEVEDDRSRLPLLPLPLPRLPPPLCDRLKVLVEGDLEVARRRLGDPRPALRLEVAVARPLDRESGPGPNCLGERRGPGPGYGGGANGPNPGERPGARPGAVSRP